MFDYLELDANGASNLPLSSRSTCQVRPERVRHMLYGSFAGIAHIPLLQYILRANLI
ncbi:hypothetical protein HC928_10630 [bacterium]|nr:hypothetical protein [bacterium]